LADATGGRLWLATVILLLASMLLSGFIDNIPYVATMAPVVAALAQQQPGDDGTVLWWALAIGADLGGNATAVGASANVVVIGLARRNDTPITFWEFTRYGLVIVAVSAVFATAYLWLRYFAFA
ncbi:MAG: SLC13 family permease, partial [Nocardioidaceae bacterium]